LFVVFLLDALLEVGQLVTGVDVSTRCVDDIGAGPRDHTIAYLASRNHHAACIVFVLVYTLEDVFIDDPIANELVPDPCLYIILLILIFNLNYWFSLIIFVLGYVLLSWRLLV